MRGVDTNVVIRMITRDDAAQLAIAERFIARDAAWVSHLVIAEAAWVLRVRYDRNHEEIANAIEMLLRQEHIVCEDPELLLNAVTLYRTKPSLRFMDCLILERARKAGHLPLGTFDKDVGRLEGAQRLQ